MKIRMMRQALRVAVLPLAFGLVIGMGMVSPGAYAELIERIVAVVNDEIILLSELDQAMVPIQQLLKKQGYSSSQQSRVMTQQRSLVLGRMIDEKLADQQVQRYGIKIDDQELDATIERIKKANRLSEERFQQSLAMDGLTYDAYREQVREQLLRSKLVNFEVRAKIVITEEDVKAYYNERKDRYQGKTKYHLRHILIKVGPEAGDLERNQGYQKAQDVYNRLEAGEAFAKLAGLFSDAPTGKNGGDLGVFEVNLLTDQARQALADKDTGQYSQIVETEQGYQIYYIEDTISAGGTSLEEAKTEIQEKLYAEQVDEKYRTWLEQLRQRAHIKIMD